MLWSGSEWEEASQVPGTEIQLAENWIRQRIHSDNLDLTDPDQHDTLLLSNTPSLSCKRYSRMKAYGNHWRTDDDIYKSMGTFDSGVACFEANPQSMGAGKDYVGILQDILVLNYGDLKTHVILFPCQWKKRQDNHGNNTYVRDDDGFLVVNFKHNLSRFVDPYAFPSQCTQVFFNFDDLHTRGSEWKVILQKEGRSRRMVEENDDIFISTNVRESGAISRSTFENLRSEPDLTGAIVLTEAENIMALQSIERLRRTLPHPNIRRESASSRRTKRRRHQ